MSMKKVMLFIFVFIVLLSAFLLAHAGMYFALVKFFSIKSLVVKNILLGSLFFLGVSFFISTFIAHVRDNVFSRGYYLFAGFWIGLLVNLLLFFFLVWIYSLFGHTVQREKMLAILAIILAIAYSIYGVWNAFNPRVIKLNVAVDSLPSSWVGKKIVQISDVHLGHVYREDFLNGVVEKINALNPEIVVITGDLFDGTDGNIDSFVAPLNNIKAPVYFVVGNHETYLGMDKVRAAIAKTKIKLLSDDLENIDGLQLIGINYPLRGLDRDISKIIPQIPGWDQFVPSVLLIHEPLQIEFAKKLGISLQLSGHTHRGQLFPFGFITSLIFRGYDHGFQREGSYAIYTSSGLGGWGPPMRTENRSEIVEITLQ